MKVLVTAGPTWAKIDDLRIITNIFTGRTGLFLACQLKKKGAEVTLLINDHCLPQAKDEAQKIGIKVIDFRYFEELQQAVDNELKHKHYDSIIHTAAVSDYAPAKTAKGKIPSGRKGLALKFKTTPKIISSIRALNPQALLIQFKLECQHHGLIAKAATSLKDNNSDFVVANAFSDLNKGYRGYIISRDKQVITVNSVDQLAANLYSLIRLLTLDT